MNQISESNQAEINKKYRTTAIIVLIQIFSTVILVGAAWFLTVPSENFVVQQNLTAMWLTVLVLAVGAFILRRFLFNWDRLKNIALIKGVTKVISTLQVNAVILCSIAELIAVVGFLVAMISGEKFEMFRAGVVALIVFLLNFPRKAIWEKVVSNLQEV